MKKVVFLMASIIALSTSVVLAESTPVNAVGQNTVIKAKSIQRSAKKSGNNAAGLQTEKDKVSYSIGVDLGSHFKAQGIDVNAATLARGLQDAMTNRPTLMSQDDMNNTLAAYQKELVAKQQAASAMASKKNQQDGAAFLTANKTKSGVITTASGLQYKVVQAGKGNHPTDNDVVTVDYEGSLLNGIIFDSSYKRGQPVTFPVSQVIPGWTEVLKLMQPGATYEVYIPSNLGYGPRGFGNVIGPNEVLVFKIHLISIQGQSANS